MRQIFPVHDEEPDLDALYEWDAPGLAERGWLRANMVSTVDGAATGPNGLSGSINTAGDRQVFGMLRGRADVILAGASTVRREGYRPPRPKPEYQDARARAGQAPAPAVCIVTRTCDLDADSDLFADARVIIATTSDPVYAEARSKLKHAAEVLELGDSSVDLSALREALVERGLVRMLLEGGPHSLGEFSEADLVDEWCVTVSPLAIAGNHMRISVAPEQSRQLELGHVLEDDSSLFCRWLVKRD